MPYPAVRDRRSRLHCADFRGTLFPWKLSRDNLDEKGRRQSEFEAAAGSEVMIDLSR